MAPLGPVVHGRFFVRLDAALGDGHTTFMTMRDQSSARDLRMGGQALEAHRRSLGVPPLASD